MGKYFGTDGFRGEAGVTLTADHAYKIGRFLGRYYGEGRCDDTRVRVLIGKDTRRSGYMLESALTAGFTASGADVYLMHVTTTASVSYLAASEHFDCAVMISASHNAYRDNGIKLLVANGEKPDEELVNLIEDYLDGCLILAGEAYRTLPFAVGASVGRVIDYTEGREAYVRHLISLGTCPVGGMRVGLDCANGGATQIAARVFRALGVNVTCLGDKPNGMNINAECGSTDVRALADAVRANELDVGFAFDGDADRCIAVDERGEVVDGDGILYLSACELAMRGELTGRQVVGTVMTNRGTEDALARAGIRLLRTPVGDKYVWREMRRAGAVLGGESSGHIIYAKEASTGDGILTALRVMDVMLRRRAPLSKLVADIIPAPIASCNVPAREPRRVMADPEVEAAVRAAEAEMASCGRVLVRASGTEPVVRVMCEGEGCERVCRTLEKVIRRVARGEV